MYGDSHRSFTEADGITFRIQEVSVDIGQFPGSCHSPGRLEFRVEESVAFVITLQDLLEIYSKADVVVAAQEPHTVRRHGEATATGDHHIQGDQRGGTNKLNDTVFLQQSEES